MICLGFGVCFHIAVTSTLGFHFGELLIMQGVLFNTRMINPLWYQMVERSRRLYISRSLVLSVQLSFPEEPEHTAQSSSSSTSDWHCFAGSIGRRNSAQVEAQRQDRECRPVFGIYLERQADTTLNCGVYYECQKHPIAVSPNSFSEFHLWWCFFLSSLMVFSSAVASHYGDRF